jgi:hypothetical protein
MSYVRGDTYIWSDGERTHLWIADGYDHWDKAVWSEGQNTDTDHRPSGVAVSENKLDEYVMMRLAELIEQRLVSDTIDRSLISGKGNGGCLALERHADRIKTSLGVND